MFPQKERPPLGETMKLKSLIKNFLSKLRKVSIEDILQILLVGMVILIIVTILKPDLTGFSYGSKKLSAKSYFDVFVRYGTFIYFYFTFIPVLVLWIVKKGLKEKWNFKTGLSFLILSIIVLAIIYYIAPGPLHGNRFFNIPDFGAAAASSSASSCAAPNLGAAAASSCAAPE